MAVMKTKSIFILACALAAACAALAAQPSKPLVQVAVRFVAPEKFTDVRDGRMDPASNRDWVLDQIKAEIELSARHYLAAGQSLEVQVTDVDLAGEFEPWHGIEFDHIRILKEVYPPRINLEFRRLDASGRVISEGTRRLHGMGYLMTGTMRANDPLRHDKELISDWMRREFRPKS